MRISDWSSDVCSSDLVATTAAAEHFTASLAGYVLSDNTWGETDVDPEMAHLFLWHAAEEVEHRHVAYDVYHHIGGGYLRRAAAMVPLAGLVLLGWPLLTSEVMRRDSSAEHTSELQSLMRIPYADFCLQKQKN